MYIEIQQIITNMTPTLIIAPVFLTVAGDKKGAFLSRMIKIKRSSLSNCRF